MDEQRSSGVGPALAVGLVLSLFSGPAWALPESPGTIKVQKVSRQQTLAGKPISFDVYIPQVKAPASVVALGHGFARSRQQMAGWGDLLASRGYVALAPDFPGPLPDHTVNAKVLSALLDWAAAESKKPGTALSGKVDSGRRGVMGHSAGGLAAVLAASTDSKINAVVGLDPVDTSGLGVKAAPQVKAASAFVRAEAHPCNSQGNAAAIYSALGGPRLTLQVVKGTHCDPEWNSGVLCTLACGGTDAQRQARFRRYAMAFLDHVLMCAPTMAPWLGGSSAKGDSAIKAIASKSYPPKQLGCKGALDGGTLDASPPGLDPGASPDVAPGHEAGQPGDLSPAGEGQALDSVPKGSEGDGCDCAVSGAHSPNMPLWMLAALLVLFKRRRPVRVRHRN